MADAEPKRWYVERLQPDGTWKKWQHPRAKAPSRFTTFEGAMGQAGGKWVRAGLARVGCDPEA